MDTVQRALAFSSVILRSPIYPASTLRYLSPSPGVDSFSQFFSPRGGILRECNIKKGRQILETRTDRNYFSVSKNDERRIPRIIRSRRMIDSLDRNIVAVARFGENGTRGDDFRGETRNKQTENFFRMNSETRLCASYALVYRY